MIRNCFAKVNILPSVINADLTALTDKKVSKATGLIKEAYNELTRILKKMNIEEIVAKIISPDIETINKEEIECELEEEMKEKEEKLQ